MRNKITLLLLTVLLVGIFAGCGPAEAEVPTGAEVASSPGMETLDSIRAAGFFTYGLEAQYRPFEYRNEKNEIIGYDIDLANEIGKRIGVEAKPIDTGWGAVIQSLYDKKFDIILGGMTATEARYEKVDFSVPYMDSGSGLLVRKDSNIKERKDLNGKIVGAGEGTPSVEQLEYTATELGISYKEAVKTYDDDAAAYEALKTNRVDAYASSFNSLNEFAKENPEFTVIEFKSDKWGAEYSVIALRKEDTGLRAIINGTLIAMKEDGTLAKLQEKWFGRSFDVPNIPPVW